MNYLPTLNPQILIDSKDQTGWTFTDDGGISKISSIPVAPAATDQFSSSTNTNWPVIATVNTVDVIRWDGNCLFAPLAVDFTDGNVFTFSAKATLAPGTTDALLFSNAGSGTNFSVGIGGGNFFVKILGTNLDLGTPANWLTDGSYNYITLRADTVNNLADVIYNGVEYTNIPITGSGTTFSTLLRSGGSGSGELNWNGDQEYLFAKQSFESLDVLRDIDADMRGEYTPFNPYRVNSTPLPGIKVLYIIADDRQMTNASILSVETTNTQGNVPPPQVPAGKHLFIVDTYEVPDPAPSGLTIGDTYSGIGRWIDGFPQ